MDNAVILKGIVETLNSQGKMVFLDGAEEERIDEFERSNQVNLPEKYKEWLRFSDGGECFLPAGVQLYGVAHQPLIKVEDDDRPSEEYVVIGALSTGDPILCEKEGERISIYNREDGVIEEDEQYDDFFAFLEDLYELLGIEEN